MDMERARAELGLAEEFTREELRRAYLRAVRKHSPERDPEGFQRVRKAQELLELWTVNPLLAQIRLEELPQPERPEPPAPEPAPEEPPAAPEQPQPTVEEPQPESDDSPVPQFTRGEDPVQDARALIAALDLPAEEASGYPPPYLCFITTLLLLANGKLKLARKLWDSFDRRARAEAWGAREMTPDIAARQQIVRECIALIDEVPKSMTKALARATLQGRYLLAVEAVQEALASEGKGLEQVFARRAPTLHAAVWPSVNAAEEISYSRMSFPWWTIVVVIGLATRLCSTSATSPTSYKSYTNYYTTQTTADEPTTATPGTPLSSALDEALEQNDCALVRELWPTYVALRRGTPEADEEAFERRRREARSRCTELGDILDSTP